MGAAESPAEGAVNEFGLTEGVTVWLQAARRKRLAPSRNSEVLLVTLNDSKCYLLGARIIKRIVSIRT